MIYSQLLVSAILIVCGLLVKRFPNLIAGYNTLSKRDKEKINIDGLSTFLKHILISLGLVTLVLYFLLNMLKTKDNIILLINSTLIVIVIIAASFIANIKFKN